VGIKAVIFDYGQVISLPQDPSVINRLADLAGAESGKFEEALWGFRDEFDRGTYTAKQYYEKILSSLGIAADGKKIEALVERDLMSWRDINSETVALMEDVKKAALTLGVLSNMPHEFLAWAREGVPVFSVSQVNLFSCELNLVKPEKAIYEKLLSVLNMEAGEVVFFDDKEVNVTAAKDLGIKAFLWKEAGQARGELLSLGISL